MLLRKYFKFKQFLIELTRKISYFRKKIKKGRRYILFLIIGRFQVVRLIYSIISNFFYTSKKIPDNDDCSTLFPHLDTKKISELLKKDGIAENIVLPQDTLKNILQYIYSQDCFADGRTDSGFNILEKNKVDKVIDSSFYIARYFDVSSSCLEILRLSKDRKLRDIATRYIGRQAKYTGASLYWTFPLTDNSKPYEFSQFHYDLEDYASLRFCFYLTDVTLESGPHVCIRGSHKRKPIISILNYFSRIYPEKALKNFYTYDQFSVLTGKAGFGFVEDVFCFHKGEIPKSQPRLFLQLHFAANNYASQEYHDRRDPSTLRALLNE